MKAREKGLNAAHRGAPTIAAAASAEPAKEARSWCRDPAPRGPVEPHEARQDRPPTSAPPSAVWCLPKLRVARWASACFGGPAWRPAIARTAGRKSPSSCSTRNRRGDRPLRRARASTFAVPRSPSHAPTQVGPKASSAGHRPRRCPRCGRARGVERSRWDRCLGRELPGGGLRWLDPRGCEARRVSRRRRPRRLRCSSGERSPKRRRLVPPCPRASPSCAALDLSERRGLKPYVAWVIRLRPRSAVPAAAGRSNRRKVDEGCTSDE